MTDLSARAYPARAFFVQGLAIRQILLIAGVMLAPGPAIADRFCEELWVTRNLIFARADHCFASPLGRALFGTDGCRSANTALPEPDATSVARLRELEAVYGCAVDTARTRLDFAHLMGRAALDVLPIPDEGQSGCGGYKGAPFPIFSGFDPETAPRGVVQPGDDITLSAWHEAGWVFVEIGRWGAEADPSLIGWMTQDAADALDCESYAG